jgi:serine/threonine protein kinase
MSPEIVDLNTTTTEYSFPSDIWSFGVILYCILSRKQKEVNFRSESKKLLIKKNIESLDYNHGSEYVEMIEACLNILLLEKSSINLKLMDFGLSKKLDSTFAKTYCGTLNYSN